MSHLRIYSQWKVAGGCFSFAPFVIWFTEDFLGFSILNFAFEWTRKK